MKMYWDKSFLFRNPAGIRRGDWNAYIEHKELYARTYLNHWDTSKPFEMTSDPHHAYRRDPHYTGWWNPVMWSTYPKQPAWTTPMPKMDADMRSHAASIPSCFIPPTEHMKPVSYPTWFPDLPARTMPHCNPYLSYPSMPYRVSWKCP